MKRRFIVAVFLALWLITGAFAPRVQIQGGRPLIWRQDVDDTFTTGYCGFPMQVHTTGTGVFHLFLDSNGNFQRLIITAPTTTLTFTNLDTGKSVRTPSVNMVLDQANPDGTGTQSLRGLLWHLVVPGQGLVTADVGRIDWLLTFDDQGNLISQNVVFSAGIQQGQFEQTLCSVLG